MKTKSTHQESVEEFMRKAGQDMPNVPTIPSEEVRLLRAKLIFEEALETITALGVHVFINTPAPILISATDLLGKPNLLFDVSASLPFDLVGVVDGCCDIAVVTTGTLSACGVSDLGPQRLVNESNLDKFPDPICPDCGERMEYVKISPVANEWHCRNGHDVQGDYFGYRREDGKWVKPLNWKLPDIQAELERQGKP